MVTGHSLGAGVAVLLAYLLKPTYTDRLTCITYGTPNTIFDTVTALEVTPYVTSICNQYDMICRAGYKPTVKMRADVSFNGSSYLSNCARCVVMIDYICFMMAVL